MSRQAVAARPGADPRARGRRFSMRRVLLHAGLSVALLIFIFPFYWMVTSSLKPMADIYITPVQLWPTRPTFDNFLEVFGLIPSDEIDWRGGASLTRTLLNSAIIAVISTAGTVFLASLAGYAFAKLRFKGRHPALGLFDPEQPSIEVHPVPCERHDLATAHAGVEAEHQQVAVHRIDHRRLDARTPARQHLGRRGNPLAGLRVVAPAASDPEFNRIAKALVVDARAAVHRAQERQRLIGRHRAVALGDQPETLLDVAAGDGIERAGAPVAEIEAGIPAIGTLGLRCPALARIDIVVARLAE